MRIDPQRASGLAVRRALTAAALEDGVRQAHDPRSHGRGRFPSVRGSGRTTIFGFVTGA
jgi:hypothetical protein